MRLFSRKPWVELQHEEEFIPKDYSEVGVERGAKLEEELVGNQDLERIHARTKDMGLQEILDWLDKHHEEFNESTFIVNTDDGNALDTLKGHHPRLIINKLGLTRIRHLNTLFANIGIEERDYPAIASRFHRQGALSFPLWLAPSLCTDEDYPLVLYGSDEGKESLLQSRGAAGPDVSGRIRGCGRAVSPG